MTEKREFYGATVDEAVDKAARDLGIGTEELSYRVVDEGNSGFLGIGARDARVEVDVSSSHVTESPAPDSVSEDPIYEERASSPATLDAARPPEGDRAEDRSAGLSEFLGDPDDREEDQSVPGEVLEETERTVSTLLDAMGFEARVDVYDAGGFVAVDVAPDNTALFIGQKGETIDALQYLVNASINRNRTSRARVVLDAEGYRQRRVEALQGMAHRTARKAVREDRPVELPPMNPSERRIVHLFLRDNPGVTTESEGTGDGRRVRVSPV